MRITGRMESFCDTYAALCRARRCEWIDFARMFDAWLWHGQPRARTAFILYYTANRDVDLYDVDVLDPRWESA